MVAVTGPRTSGKRTLVRKLVDDVGGTFLDLDDPAVRVLAAGDPTAFVRDIAEPTVVDEFQRVPDLLAAIKAELNVDRRPGRFVLAGSARHQVVPELADYLTGRVELLTLWPFAMAEIVPDSPSVVDRLFDGSLDDSGLAAFLQGVTADRMSPVDPAAVSQFGALLETFVVTEVLKQMGWASQLATAYHYRTTDGVEVALVLEALDGRVTAAEVKAGSRVNAASTRGLVHLRDRLGERFVAGVVLTTGGQAQRLGDRLAVAPVDMLWEH